MKQLRRFTREFEDEAIRLVRTSGRTQREIAEDLGVGLSTLVRWLGRRRDRAPAAPGGGRGGGRDRAPEAPGGSSPPDVTAELKRLRRENEILRQERDILKRAAAF